MPSLPERILQIVTQEPPGLSRADVHAVVLPAGAAVMCVELIGARLLTPFFGATLYVWTAVLAVTLLALAAGYVLGGFLAGRPHAGALALVLLAAGAFLVLVPSFDRALVRAAMSAGLRGGSLLAAGGILLVPLAALGAAGPVAVAALARGGVPSGRAAGEAMAVSTLGSVAGTLATGYWLLPSLSVDQALGVTALLLAPPGAWMARRTSGAARWIALAAAAALGIFGIVRAVVVPPLPENVLFRANGTHGEVKVVQGSEFRMLLVDNIPQAEVRREGGSSWSYLYVAAGQALLARPRAHDALVVGMGGGVLSDLLRRLGLRVDEVEVDPVIVEAAEGPFAHEMLKRRADERLWVQDGRTLLAGLAPDSYDLILCDAYSGESVPAQLVTFEAMREARRALRKDGLLGLNLISQRDNLFLRSAFRTLAAASGAVAVFPCVPDKPDEEQNFMLFAAKDGAPLRPARERLEFPAPYARHRASWSWREPPALDPEGGRVLTDRFGPDPSWDVLVREKLRRRSWDNLPPHVLGFE